MPDDRLVIAIDGPSGSGKSTTARAVARRLGLSYLDTGAMYRAVAVAFLCRSGVRSNLAAALVADNGYAAAYNIVEGFEGDKNAAGQRRVNGWQMAGLPWRQD